MASVQTRKPPIIGNKANNPAPAVRASPAAAPVIRASPASPGATPPGGATPPRGATPTRSAAPASSDDIEQKKRLIAQRLQEKEKRLSRLSMALGSGDPRASQKQQEVEQLAEKLRKMQGMLERSEKVRKHEEAEEQRRINEERAMHRLTQDLEKSAPAGAMSKSQKNRRTQNMMSLMRESNGSISEDKLQALEAKESAQDERERQERKVKMEATERRLKEVNDKIRDQAKAREEQNMLKLQKQLEFMENRLKDLEGGSSGGKVKEEEDDDDQSMRDWEEKMRALRQERERALAQRKQDMNKRLRELQEMVEQKKREREDLQSSAQEKKYQDMVAMLKNFDNDSYKPPAAAGGGGGGSVGGFSQADLEKWMQQKVEERLGALEAKMKADHARAMAEKEAQMMQYTGSGGGGVDMSLILDKLKQFDELSKKVGQIDDKIKKGGFSAAPGVELTMTYDEIVKEIQNLQGIIFDPNSDEKTIADANINLEKVMQQLEQTDEYRKEKEEKRAAAEKLNKEALERVKTAMRAMTPEQLKKRLTDNPELKLVLMEPAQIGKLHQNDFKGFAMRGLSLDEVRAVRGCCPTFRKDQKIQMEWQESIEAKIEDMATKAASGPPPPKPQTKKAKPGKEWKKPPAAKGGAASSGDMFAQIRARAKALGGGDDAPEPEEPEKPAAPNVAIVASGPPPPPPPGAKKAPPPPMGKPPPPPVFNSEPPPTQAPKGTPASVVEQRKTLQDLNALNAKSNANGQLVSPEDIKNSVDQLHSMVFSGGPEADIVNRLKVLSEQIKSVAGDHKELAPKARFLIMAVKEAMVSRNGTPNEVSHSKQKLSVVVNSLKRALDG